MAYVKDDLFLPVGHTDEASSSAGGSSTLYSPFNGSFDPRQAAMATMRQLSPSIKTNPPDAQSIKRLTQSEFKAMEEITGSVTSIPLYIGLGGFIVKKDWDSVISFGNAILKYIDDASNLTKKKVSKRTGKVTVTPFIKKGRGTYYSVVRAFVEYAKQLKSGVSEPYRMVTVRGKKVKKSIWSSIADCCLAVQGNTKLPFAAYSEMPIVTCPGAGSVSDKYGVLSGNALGNASVSNSDGNGCANWCYSLKALAKPSFVARMLILTMGMSIDPERHVATVVGRMIEENGRAKKPNILRLFVDGDFRDEEAVRLWMEGCKVLHRYGVKVYGYSKSWQTLLNTQARYGKGVWPSNYQLNLSSGSRFNDAMKEKVRKLPIVRDEFIAVNPLLKLLEKSYQKAEVAKRGPSGKAIGRVMANRVFDTYNKALAKGDEQLKRAKSLRNNAEATRWENYLNSLVYSLHARIQRMTPDLYEAYVDYEQKISVIKGKVSSYNASVITAKKALKGNRAEAIALGKVTYAPGQVLQAATWKFLQLVKQTDEFACPIDCGRCPRSAVADHDRSVKRLMNEEFKELREELKTVLNKPFTAPAGSVHACGNAKLKKKIIIGVH